MYSIMYNVQACVQPQEACTQLSRWLHTRAISQELKTYVWPENKKLKNVELCFLHLIQYIWVKPRALNSCPDAENINVRTDVEFQTTNPTTNEWFHFRMFAGIPQVFLFLSLLWPGSTGLEFRACSPGPHPRVRQLGAIQFWCALLSWFNPS